MFTQYVEHVADTRIFARPVDDSPDQILVYSMSVAAPAALAMVLPLPTPVATGDDAVTFIDLSGYPRFFDDLGGAFPQPQASRSAPIPAGLIGAAPLTVHEVGDYDASFVATLDDFVRLDARFRMSDHVWRRLPAYRDHGFAVFQLRPNDDGTRVEGEVHPMAFRFPRRDPSTLFFPTVHVHDGSVPRRAAFDHTLYWQLATPAADGADPFDIADAASVARCVDADRASGTIDVTLGCRRRRIVGTHRNADTVIQAR